MKKRIGVKWYVKELDLYERMLTHEQIGELVRAVMHYAATGEKVPVSEGIVWPFAYKCLQIDAENEKRARAKARREARRQDE